MYCPLGRPTPYDDRNFSDEEREFMLAMDRHKRANHRPYPDCRDVLQVIYSLGYRKQPPDPEGEGE